MALAILVVLYAYLGLAAALSKEGWRSQSIYQLLTDRYARTNGDRTACSDLGKYCGGTWQGIINNLDYIQKMGFTAVWISPITEQIQGTTHYGDAFHGFWPQKINQVNSNFGTAADLKALSSALHQRGMYLMIDMVTNDMAWNGGHTTVDYSQFDVFNDPSEYHPFCQVSDYQNSTQATECWTGDENLELPDLALENSTVVSKWTNWVSNIVKTYNIDGIRLDACLEQNKEFFLPFEQAAGVYIICEVYNYPIDGVCDYQNYVSGLLNFPLWYKVIDAFSSNSGDMGNLSQGITQMQGSCKDVSLLGNFVENHDVNRLPCSVSDSGLDQNAIAFTMLNDGIPIIYAGEEQYYTGCAPPADRETTWTSNYDTTNIYYQLIQKINLFRNCVIAKDSTYLTSKSVPFFLDTQVIGVKKGSTPATQVVGVFNNRGTEAIAYTINMTNTGYTAGQQVYEMYTTQTVTVTPEGYLPVYMYGGQPRIYYLLSSQCFGNASTTSTTSATSSIPSSTPIALPTTTPLSIGPTTSVRSTSPTIPTLVPGSSSSSAVRLSSTPGSTTSSAVASVLPSSSGQISSSGTSTPIRSSAIGATSVPTSSLQIAPSSSSTSSSISTALSVPGSSTPASTTPISSGAAIPGTTSPVLSSSAQISPSTSPPVPISAAVASSLSISSSPISSSSTPVSTSGTPFSSSSSSYPSSTPASASSVFSSAAIPGISSPSSSIPPSGSAVVTSGTPASSVLVSASLLPTVSPSTALTPATTPPVCPSADGASFILNGKEYNVGCGIGSDQSFFAQLPGHNISDCASKCITYTGAPACEAVTYINGVCYLKSEPGAVHNEDGSDSAFITSTPNGPETIAASFLSGNISQAAPVCPNANGNTFESNGYVYVVGCSIDNYVVDISTSPGADLATCVESCITFSGTVFCAAVTYNNGNCHFKASVGTTFHAVDAETAFIIASPPSVHPAGIPPGLSPPGSSSAGSPSLPPHPTGNPPFFPPNPIGNPPFPPNPIGNPPCSPNPIGDPSNPHGNPPCPPNPIGNPLLPPKPTGTYTVTLSPYEVTVYAPLNETCP